MNRFCLSSCLLALMGVAAAPSHAASIIQPFGVSDTSHYSDNVGNNADSLHTIDNTGLSAALPSGPIPGSYPTNNVTVDTPGFNQGFAAQLSGASVITYVLVDPAAPAIDLTGGHFYQYGGDSPGRALKSADISVSTNGVLFTPAGTLDLSAAGLNYPQPNSGTQDPGKDFSLSGSGIRQVRLTNLVPFDAGTGFVGFGEIRFIGNAVPEPASIALFALGSTLTLIRRPSRNRSGRIG